MQLGYSTRHLQLCLPIPAKWEWPGMLRSAVSYHSRPLYGCGGGIVNDSGDLGYTGLAHTDVQLFTLRTAILLSLFNVVSQAEITTYSNIATVNNIFTVLNDRLPGRSFLGAVE